MNKVVKNTFWIISCKVLQMLLNLVVSMMTARYLGPSNYGLINYAASIVTFLVPVMQLGLRSTLVQELVEQPEDEGKILGTAVTLNVLSAIACIIGIISVTSVLNAGETETIIICGLYSVSLLFQATEMVQYWFQAKLQSKYPSIAMLISYVIVSAYKIYLLATGKNVYWFAVSQAVDALLISIILYIFYKRVGEQKLSVSLRIGKKMFSKSKYYIVSGLMVNIFQFTDRIMLKFMMGDDSTGFYSAAVVCAGISSFVFMAIIDSSRPSILRDSRSNKKAFEEGMCNLYCVIIYLSLAQSIGITLLANPIIRILYGEQYIPSISVLRLVVWYTTFSYLGTVRNIWILAEGKQKVLWKMNLCGALANIILNYVLIPYFGGEGAAVASIITQFISNVVMNSMLAETKGCNRLMAKGVNPRRLVNLVGMLRRK